MFEDKYIFTMRMKVRDYEIDSEGIVNNAVYLHYLEHTRHEFCQSAGFSFRDMRNQGIVPVLTKVEIRYKNPLESGDEMVSCLNMSRKGPLFIFNQDIYRPDGSAVVEASVSVACIENGRLSRGDMLARKFQRYL